MVVLLHFLFGDNDGRWCYWHDSDGDSFVLVMLMMMIIPQCHC